MDQPRRNPARVYSGWKPQHPALTATHYDPQIDGNTFFEGGVVWDLFLWTLTRVVPHHPVVADTPFNHLWNREMFYKAASGWSFPVIEVALDGDPGTMLARAQRRAQQPDVHEIKARFSVRAERYETPTGLCWPRIVSSMSTPQISAPSIQRSSRNRSRPSLQICRATVASRSTGHEGSGRPIRRLRRLG